MDTDLAKAQAIVDELTRRIEDAENLSEWHCPNLIYTTTTLAICIGEITLWEDQNSDLDDFTVDACWEVFLDHCRNLSNYLNAPAK